MLNYVIYINGSRANKSKVTVFLPPEKFVSVQRLPTPAVSVWTFELGMD